MQLARIVAMMASMLLAVALMRSTSVPGSHGHFETCFVAICLYRDWSSPFETSHAASDVLWNASLIFALSHLHLPSLHSFYSQKGQKVSEFSIQQSGHVHNICLSFAGWGPWFESCWVKRKTSNWEGNWELWFKNWYSQQPGKFSYEFSWYTYALVRAFSLSLSVLGSISQLLQ